MVSKYTTEVRFICENYAGLTESKGYQSVNEILENVKDKVFDFDFPIFDENYRGVLEKKILKHYYTREIGMEAVGLWKLKLDTKMNEIMPYYNQLYKSSLIEFNPMYDVDLTTDYKKVDDGSNVKSGAFSENGSFSENSESNGSDSVNSTNADVKKNDHWDYYSDTPQGGINGLEDNSYLTNARHVTDDGTGSISTVNGGSTRNDETDKNGSNSKSGNNNSNEIIKNTEDYLQHVIGKSAGTSYSQRLKEFRDTFLNIDMLVIDELSDLFMNIW